MQTPDRSTRVFDPATLREIHKLAVDADLAHPDRRPLLLDGPRRAAGLSRTRRPADQILADLQALNRPAPGDGPSQIVEWLRNAAALLGETGHTHAQRFAAWADEAAAARPTECALRLLDAEPADPPRSPYPPVLGAYDDRRLFAGREAELDSLFETIDTAPVTCLFAMSGAGKSSLLCAGLLPELRDARRPVGLSRTPHEASAPADLIAQVLEPAPAVDDPRRFAAALAQAWTLAERPPVLVLDQFEEVFKGDRAEYTRARLGPYLAAGVLGAPDGGPLCRWILAYRREFHGEVEQWLGDVLTEARAAGRPDIDDLPHDLLHHGRHIEWALPVFGTAAGRDPARAAFEAFRAAIVTPLDHAFGGRRYTLAPADADRLARAFADARLAQPDRPLVPELQVVLNRMLAAHVDGRLAVPAAVESWIDDALASHVRASVERAVPAGRAPVQHERTLVLAALHRLVDPIGRGSRRLPVGALHDVVRAGGRAARHERVFECLTEGPGRLLVVQSTEADGACYALGHDRLAPAVEDLVEMRVGADFDPRLLELVDFIGRRVTLHRNRDPAALGRDDGRFDALAEARGLLWDADRIGWWADWEAETIRTRRTERRRRWARRALVIGLIVAAFAIPLGWRSAERAVQQQALEGALGSSDMGAVLSALGLLVGAGVEAADAVARLPASSPVDRWQLVSETFIDLPPDQDAALRLALVTILIDRTAREGPPAAIVERFGRLLAAVDAVADRAADPQAARAARRAVVAAMRARFPLPDDPAAAHGPLHPLPGGAFEMGADDPDADWDETPHRARVGPFALGRTEVTTGQYRRLLPDHRPSDAPDRPAIDVSWYAATAFAAWIGARLPTEAEWEYACRDAGRARGRYCSGDTPDDLRRIAWVDLKNGAQARRVARRDACGGLYDMHGNVWEWTADLHQRYPPAARTRRSGRRVARGGMVRSQPRHARCAERSATNPTDRAAHRGFRLAMD